VSGRVLPWALAAVAAAGGLAACTAGTEQSQVRQVAVEFVTAVQDGRGQHACDLLTPDAEKSVTGATEFACAAAVVNIDESGSDVHRIQVWGDAAQVKVGSDTVFLQRLPAGWQVRAAGCQFQPGAAYDCDVEG
jgi:hypothetical protein